MSNATDNYGLRSPEAPRSRSSQQIDFDALTTTKAPIGPKPTAEDAADEKARQKAKDRARGGALQHVEPRVEMVRNRARDEHVTDVYPPNRHWPVTAPRAILTNGPTGSQHDGDSGKLLVDLLNALVEILGEDVLDPFVSHDAHASITTLNANNADWFERFVVKAAVPALIAALVDADAEALTELVKRSQFPTSALRDSEAAAEAVARREHAQAKAAQEMAERQHARAVAEVAQDEADAREAAVAEKLAELTEFAAKTRSRLECFASRRSS